MRTFVAIEVNDQNVLNSIRQVQSELNIKAKPVELHNMHFTVQFLGEVSEEMARKISDALSSLELEKLAEMIHAKLSQLGLHPDKKFKPHVTIFRIKNKIEGISNKLEKFSAYSFGKQMISEIKFKKSELASEGPIYTDLLVVKGKK